MSLPAPNLDDRRFQELVDDAKRLVQQRCPNWTDHNVSDPGVTLIETFAFMTDQLLYRLNRVPDRLYIKFLELIGLQLFPPNPARAEVTFRLSAARDEPVVVNSGTKVATPRTSTDEGVTFTTTRELAIVPCTLARLASTVGEGQIRDHGDHVKGGFACFDNVPKPDDALLIGLSDAVPSCLVLLRFDGPMEGVGVDPLRPPLIWEAWDGTAWAACEVEEDETGGLNRAGDLLVHVPPTHQASVVGRHRAGWLRCRVVASEDDQPAYSASPRISSCTACTVGGTVEVVQAETIENEIVGVSEGVSGQRFSLRHTPVVSGDGAIVLEVAGDDGWETWERVESFAGSGAMSRHFMLDCVFGEVILGPAVREADGTLQQFGAVPPKGTTLRIPSYRTGGGRRGNLAPGALSVLRSPINYIHEVKNRRRASGGVDPEDLENAKQRGPILLRTRNRAVTAEDYEELARASAPEVARARCLPAGEGAEVGGVRVLIVPSASDDEHGRLRFEHLVPAEETLAAIATRLDACRTVGARVAIEPPFYQGITAVAQVQARLSADRDRVRRDALAALYGHFHPLRGGPEGTGWPFGRPVLVGEAYAVLQRVPGVEYVENVRLYAADPISGERGEASNRVEVAPGALVFSYEHQVRVEKS